MSTIEWGAAIPVNGERPVWLKDDEVTVDLKTSHGWRCTKNGAGTCPSVWGWGAITHIRLPAAHSYYTATSRGFEYWPGGASAPDDVDVREKVLYRSGDEVGFTDYMRWGYAGVDGNPSHWCADRDIIGYKRRTETVKPIHAATDTLTLPRTEYAALVQQVEDLQKRRDDLLAANNELVEQRRAVTAERDALKQCVRNLAEVVQKFDTATAETQWAFGPWVKVSRGTAGCGRGIFYQVRYGDSVSEVYEGDSEPWARNGEFRRAYRIGEWYDHDGSETPALEVGSWFDMQRGIGALISTTHKVEPRQHWLGVTRFRPTAAAE